jgi:hypothetical protein
MIHIIVFSGRATSSILRNACTFCLLLAMTSSTGLPLCAAPEIQAAQSPAAETGQTVTTAASEADIKASELPKEVQDTIASKPSKSGHSDNLLPAGLAAAGLLLLPFDSQLERAIPRTPAGERSDAITEAANTLGDGKVLIAALGGMYLLGQKKDKDTAKLALSALVNAAITTQIIKSLAGRERPGTSDGEVKFLGPSLSGKNLSFPSGHTSAAFAVATVLADRNPKQKWLYYGLATAVGLARIRKSAHFPSDVLVGAGIGINSGNNALGGGVNILSIKF